MPIRVNGRGVDRRDANAEIGVPRRKRGQEFLPDGQSPNPQTQGVALGFHLPLRWSFHPGCGSEEADVALGYHLPLCWRSVDRLFSGG